MENLLKRRMLTNRKITRDQTMEIPQFLILNILGSMLYAGGIYIFAAPHQIAPGGASGLAVLVNYLCGFPIGIFVFIFNIPFLIMSYRYLNRVFILKALMSISLLSIITDYVIIYFPVYEGDPLLAAMLAGSLMGIGLALVHMSRSTTGGISLIGLLMQKIWPQFEVGKWLFILNFGVVLISGVVFKNIETVLYASITIFISSKFMDSIIYGVNRNKLFMIISDEAEKIKENILSLTNKGVTILSGEGGYSQGEKKVILCAVDKNEYTEVEKTIMKVDSKAFIIVTDTSHIVGNGFKNLV